MIISLKQYSHVLIFKVEGEPDATVSLTRRADGEPLAGVITQTGYEPHVFGYSGYTTLCAWKYLQRHVRTTTTLLPNITATVRSLSAAVFAAPSISTGIKAR